MRDTLAHIEAHPDEHDQSMFARRTPCGTTYCFAGHAVLLGDPDAQFYWVGYGYPGVEVSDHLDGPTMNRTGHVHIEEYAAHLLGLDGDEINDLFFEFGPLDVVRQRVEDILARWAATGEEQ
jgi:hypothetical protein